MEKIARLLIVVLALLMGSMFITTTNFAMADGIESNAKTVIKENIRLLEDLENAEYKIAGSPAEKITAQFLVNKMNLFTNFTPKGGNVEVPAFQTFSFVNNDGVLSTSQNVVFLKDNANTDKKIVVATHMDSLSSDSKTKTAGVNSNLAGVSTLLYIASKINGMDIDFDVEIVFFGAGECNFAGSKFYTQRLDEDMQKNILLMINLDNLAVGDYLYAYDGDKNDDVFKYVNKVAKSLNINLKKPNTLFTLKEVYESPIDISYSHIGLESDNLHFYGLGINTIYFFKGNYTDLSALGGKESLQKENITNTENDNLNFIIENYGENFVESLADVASIVIELFKQQDCETVLAGIIVAKNSIWNNGLFICTIMFAMLILFRCIGRLVFERAVVVSGNSPKESPKLDRLIEKYNTQMKELQSRKIDIEFKQNFDEESDEEFETFKKQIESELQKEKEQQKEPEKRDNEK